MIYGRELARAAAVLALFALMFYYAYFLTLDVSLDDVRAVAPGFVRAEIDRAIARLPPGQQHEVRLPLPEVKRYGDIYMSPAVVIPGEMDAMPWILAHTDKSDRFVADIFGAEVIMGMTARVSTEGGDWANSPDPIRMMSDTHEIYRTDDPEKASRMAKALNATLVYLPRRTLNTGWWLPYDEVDAGKFDDPDYFEKLYDANDVKIYRIV